MNTYQNSLAKLVDTMYPNDANIIQKVFQNLRRFIIDNRIVKQGRLVSLIWINTRVQTGTRVVN
jgi:hypothetical protein